MKNTSKLVYLLGLPVLAGAFIMCFMNVVIGDVSISLPEPLNLHRPQLWSLILGSDEETSAKVTIDTGDLRLKISKGLVMGQGNEASAVASLIGGGTGNRITSVEKSGIGGGNTNEIGSSYSVIGGGKNNNVYNGIPADGGDDGYANAIAGGSYNGTTSGGTVVGGNNNNAAGASVILGGQNNQIGGDGSIALGNNSRGGGNSFSWNSSVVEDYSAIIMASGGTLIGTYEPIAGVNLVVEGGVKIGTGELTGNVGEIRMQDGCFYGSDGSEWHVINKRSRANCPKVMCTVGSISFQPGEEMQVYTQPYSLDCSQPSVLVKVSCMPDGTLSLPGDFYPYCYDLSGGIWYEGGMAECGAANGGTYVNSPTITDGLCRSGTPSSVVASGNSAFTWTCSTGSSTVSCAATKVYPCNGEQPTGPGVDMGSTTQVYSDTLKSWTQVEQTVNPGICQWRCLDGYIQTSSGCILGAWCGDADGRELTSAPAGDSLCAAGDASSVSSNCDGWSWTCTDGSNNIKCKAKKHRNSGDPEYWGTITICNPNNTSECLTMMDRNLGACAAGTGIDSFGYYYQWGNNYGFPTTGKVMTRTTRVDVSGFGPGNYYSSNLFYIDPRSANWATSNNTNLWGDDTNTNESRQGPCPDGYHIPSQPEWGKVVNWWKNAVYDGNRNTIESQFVNSFLIPMAGERHSTTSNVTSIGSWGCYWSTKSDPSRWGIAYTLNINEGGDLEIDPNEPEYYDGGRPLRCFKNVPESTSSFSQSNSNFEDLDTYFITNDGTIGHYTLMDRNLGATAYMNQPGKTANEWYGNYYQWGNNYGFPNQGTVNTSKTGVNTSGYGPGNYYSSNTFVINEGAFDAFDWADPHNNNLWGGGNDSSSNGYGYPMTNSTQRQGPCPSGYHVPSHGEWRNIIEKWVNGYNSEGHNVTLDNDGHELTDSGAIMMLHNNLLLPFAGNRGLSANAGGKGSVANYWTSTPWLPDTHSYYLTFFSPDLYPTGVSALDQDYGSRIMGYSVRCFKNSTNSSMTLHPNGGTGAIVIVHGGKITKLGTPTKAGNTFGGWYNDSSFTSQVLVNQDAPAHLYAKWN